jgi:hypothetical protein
LPAASAGAIARASSASGAFHGTMIATTPTGSRMIMLMLFGCGICERPKIQRVRPA